MKALLTASAAVALTISLAAPALADCATEIQTLKSSNITGSINAPATGTPATSAMNAAVGDAAASGQDVKAQGMGQPTAAEQATADAAQSAAPAGQAPANQASGTPATIAMNAAVGDAAASGQDVKAQGTGQPTVAEQATSVAALIQQAENYQKLGDEEGCLSVIGKAKTLTQQ